MINDRKQIEHLLRNAKTIAVVGLSPDPTRDSHRVAGYLQRYGYRIFPVNPSIRVVLGERAYASLLALPQKPDVVDVFRRAEFVPPIVEDAIEIGAKAIWLQLGVAHPAAARRAEAAGLTVVMDRCMMVEHRRWRTGYRFG